MSSLSLYRCLVHPQAEIHAKVVASAPDWKPVERLVCAVCLEEWVVANCKPHPSGEGHYVVPDGEEAFREGGRYVRLVDVAAPTSGKVFLRPRPAAAILADLVDRIFLKEAYPICARAVCETEVEAEAAYDALVETAPPIGGGKRAVVGRRGLVVAVALQGPPD